jgi:septum site-determining protein MinD
MMIYAILSGKGGVGKTTLAANLGILASRLGKKTLLVDTDLAAGNLALYLGVKEMGKTLHELLAGGRDFNSCIYSLGENLNLLPSGLSLKGFLKAELGNLPKVLKRASKGYEVVFLDTPPGISRNTIIPLRCAESVILVTTPDAPSVNVTLKAKAIASMLDKPIAGTVINRVRRGIFGKRDQPLQVAKQLGTEILGVLPEEPKMRDSVERGKPIVLADPKSPVSRALREVSLKLLGLKKGG